MIQNTGKERSRRIDRFYYEALDPFIRFKRITGTIGLIVGLGYALWLFSSSGLSQLSSGDLSHAHAAWNDNGCEQCHLPNIPIRPDALFGSRKTNIQLNNEKCNSKCHSMTGHFADQTSSLVLEQESCTECHREHLGKEFSLVELADKSCVRCHSKIEGVAKVFDENSTRNVYDFSLADGHPEFRSLENDPGGIKFSHTHHMRPGQPRSPGDLTAKKLSDIPMQYRSLYKDRVGSDGLIQLVCIDCHQQDNPIDGFNSEPFASNTRRQSVPSNQHFLYRSVEFEKHCVACHDLSGMPHGLNKEQSRIAIHEVLAKSQVETIREKLQLNENDSLEPISKTKESILRSIDELKPRLETLLANSGWCAKCHRMAAKESDDIVISSTIPQRWFKHAVFPHGSHLMVDCITCHGQAFTKSNETCNSEADAQQVMIAGIESCRECHVSDPAARAEKFEQNQPYVARANCVDCHQYHIEDRPHGTKDLGESQVSSSKNFESIRQFVFTRSP